MLSSLKIFNLLEGFRGKRAADIPKLIEKILRFANMCEELEHKLVDAEINPLMVSEGKGGVKAADGLLVLKKNKAQNIVHFILLTP